MVVRSSYVKTYHHDTYAALERVKTSGSCTGKVVFITGAGTGIGKATARAFACASARAIFIAGRTESTLAKTKSELENDFPSVIVNYFVLDVCDAPKVAAAFHGAVQKANAKIDILVNNAGYIGNIEAMGDFDKLWTHFDINVKGFMIVVREFLNNAIEKGATLINISSGAAVISYIPGLCGYAASKLATFRLMQFLHNEEKDYRGLRVFNLQPGAIATAIAEEGKTVCVDTG